MYYLEIIEYYHKYCRTWVEENMGMQCRICGKVFTRNQTLPFHRHLATHDSEPETVCWILIIHYEMYQKT